MFIKNNSKDKIYIELIDLSLLFRNFLIFSITGG
jgi:hypothetical protein